MKKLLIILSLSVMTITAFAQDDTYYTGDEATVTIKAETPPPPIPDYVQPPCPEEGFIWTPGYWAWGAGGYYWVPGVWVAPPSVGLLWTPGYWGFYGGYYGWHHGYWGASIGYYGGVNYGFGYYGSGFAGGRWEGGHFLYNTAVWHVGRGFHNTYVNRSVVVNHNGARASYNGPGGVKYRPTTNEHTVMHDNNSHVTRSNTQVNHETNMGTERGQFHSAQQPRPATHSMSQPGGQRYNERGRSISTGGGAPRGGGGAPHGGGGGGAPRGGGGGGHGGGGRH